MRVQPVIVQDRLLEQGAEGIGRPHAEPAHFEVLHVPDPLYSGLGLFQDLDGAGIELLAVIAEGDVPGVARQQFHAQFFFQLPDLLGNGALGDEEGLGRQREAAQTPHLHKVFQLP